MEEDKIYHHYFETLGSTQDFARNELGPIEPENIYLIQSGEQTQGRGTHQRDWASPKGAGLYLTTAFLLPQRNPFLPCLTTAFAQTAIEVLEGEGCKEIAIKWPNDLRFHKKKLGGILCEIVEDEPEWVRCLVGFGLNLTPCDKLADQKTTSVAEAWGKQLDPQQLALKIGKKWQHNLSVLIKEGLKPFLSFITERLESKNEWVQLQTPAGIIEGTLKAIDINGALVLEDAKGKVTTHYSGRLIAH